MNSEIIERVTTHALALKNRMDRITGIMDVLEDVSVRVAKLSHALVQALQGVERTPDLTEPIRWLALHTEDMSLAAQALVGEFRAHHLHALLLASTVAAQFQDQAPAGEARSRWVAALEEMLVSMEAACVNADALLQRAAATAEGLMEHERVTEATLKLLQARPAP